MDRSHIKLVTFNIIKPFRNILNDFSRSGKKKKGEKPNQGFLPIFNFHSLTANR